jgi:hypothetical protein
MSEQSHTDWHEQPDGSRVKHSNGIRIVDRSVSPEPTGIEHLVAEQQEDGRVVVLGLDTGCRPVYTTTLYAYL